MHAVFVACFLAGALATALFAILGAGGGGGHAHAGHHHVGAAKLGHGQPGHQVHAQAAHAHGLTSRLGESLGWIASWFSPLTLAGAALWFGGVGLLTEGSLGGGALLAAAAAALVGAAVVRFAFLAFLRAGTPPLAASAEGAIGTVNATIRAEEPGEVILTLEGLHRSIPARSTDGQTITRGTTVAVVQREGGFAWVTPLDPLEGAPDAPALLPTTASDERENPGEHNAPQAERT